MVYFMLSADYNKYMDTQQEILYRIHQTFEKQGIEFATPVQTLFVRSSGQENGFIDGSKMAESHPEPGSR
jgi:small-conductance mechanosensitive channel